MPNATSPSWDTLYAKAELQAGDFTTVSPLVSRLPWTHHLIMLTHTKHPDEREFYMLAAIQA